ncbi:MAG: transketolase [Eubacterium sp.]|nr:transketolase [Eubacterium sp.]
MERKELSYYEEIARRVRIDIIKATYNAGSGHPGGSLSCADILTALYFGEMNIDPEHPDMKGRDRFVLSKGHAVPAQYSVLAERGYYPVSDIMTLRKLGSSFQGHGNMHMVPGIEMSTGSLGQGFSASVGMAIADRLDKSGARVYTLLGDGEIQEGLVWEAAMAAAHYKLSDLTAIVDWNGLQIDGRNEDVMTVAPIKEKFEAFGWHALSIDGHDFSQIFDALDAARAETDRPTVIVAKTIKGKGVSFMEDQVGWHGKAPNEEEAKQAVRDLGGEW